MSVRVEQIRLVTYRWEAMQHWWSAMLDVPFTPIGVRTAIAEGPGLCVLLEHSPLTMNASSEVAGIATITVSTPSIAAASATMDRLSAVGSALLRATDDPLGILVWFRDPDGCDVAIRLPFYPTPNNLLNTEIDPFHILDLLHTSTRRSGRSGTSEQGPPWQPRIRRPQ